MLISLNSGCASLLKKKDSMKKVPEIKTVVSKADKYQWKVKESTAKGELRRGGIAVDLQFSDIELTDVVSLLMGTIKENYIVADDLIGQVDIEVKGKFKRDEVIKMVQSVLNSKNYQLIKNGSLYGVYNIEHLEELNIQPSEDNSKNVYLYHLQYANSVNLKLLLNDIFPDISITENTNINVLVVKSSSDEYKKVREVIKKIDKRPKQVLVEFTIMEVTLNDALKYGVEYFVRQQKKKGGNLSLLAEGITTGSGTVTENGMKAFSFRQELNTFITILNTVSKVELISNPNVLVQDGQTSVIKIGREEPIRKGTSVSENGQRSESIEYRDVGVILNVKCDVEENNVVKLFLSQEVSDIVVYAENPLIDSPSFTKNTIQLTTFIDDGQKIYIGGLIENSKSVISKKVPLLGDIPFLGHLFKSSDISKAKTELILLLSVDVLNNVNEFENKKLKFVRKI